ncbi:hypothetical protein GH714_034703 [Hevea brasiliensis]|uniref:RNase H type-1 domain-containing protein n=1 Tax=Hevea brasiliensis TaxID=3981 RepID=A0A6A6MHN1_HEVBR|nr:hypothetical protein GH714_034703 [Hevea brasiliensis]
MALPHYKLAVPVDTSNHPKTTILNSFSSFPPTDAESVSLSFSSFSLGSKARNLSIFPRLRRIGHKIIDENVKESFPEHETQMSSIRWHLSEGGFQEFKLLERLGEGNKPTAIIGEVADDLNLDLVIISMEAIHSKHVDANLLAEFIPCPSLTFTVVNYSVPRVPFHVSLLIPPSPLLEGDVLWWRFISSGNFTLKSDYEWLYGDFGVPMNKMCFVKQVWLMILPLGWWDEFSKEDRLDKWVMDNINSKEMHSVLLGIACWKFWNRQNMVLFSEEHSLAKEWAHKTVNYASDVSNADPLIVGSTNFSTPKVESWIAWQTPRMGYFKLNTDGSVKGLSGFGGGIIREGMALENG